MVPNHKQRRGEISPVLPAASCTTFNTEFDVIIKSGEAPVQLGPGARGGAFMLRATRWHASNAGCVRTEIAARVR